MVLFSCLQANMLNQRNILYSSDDKISHMLIILQNQRNLVLLNKVIQFRFQARYPMHFVFRLASCTEDLPQV